MYEHHSDGSLDYFPCRYGKSRLLFRGPKRRTRGAFCAMIGGTETYGKFIEQPFPALVENEIGKPVVNLGCVNAGLDAFIGDDSIVDICSAARVTVIQVLGAQNLSNRFYRVHPRRNDRFVRASPMLRSMFREVDFTEFHFTRHLLGTLRDLSAERFAVVEEELRAAWIGRMRLLSERIPGKTVLLWLSNRTPSGPAADADMKEGPLFVDQDMIDVVRPHFTDYVEVTASPAAQARGLEGMIFSPLEQPAAAETAGPAVHDEVAERLAPVVAALM